MPFLYNNLDCSPLVIDSEFDITDENMLAQYVGKIILGHYAHVKRIIAALSTTPPNPADSDIDSAIARLKGIGKTTNEIEKRDGWIFQIISWLALLIENKGKVFYCQQPHDAPAQHGLDGVALILKKDLTIENIIISEDKCTTNQRVVIPKIWNEFTGFEDGLNNNKVVSRISAMIEALQAGKVLEANMNNIYNKNLWKYRVGINRTAYYQTVDKRKNLFAGYDGCVKGEKPDRRLASTLHKEDIRDWMEKFSVKVIQYLETLKTTGV